MGHASIRHLFFVGSGLFAMACSETNLSSLKEAEAPSEDEEAETPDPVEPEPTPDLGPPLGEVSPEGVDLGIVCGDKLETVTVTSLGESPLEVTDIRVVGPGWVASHLPLPVLIKYPA